MTPPQHIYLNGVLLDGRQETLSAQRLLQDNYVHAAVNTSAHSPLYLEKHLAYAAESYRKLYGTVPQFDTMQLREGIEALLDADRMPRLGNIVRIYLLPSQRSGDAVPDLLAMADHSTIYRGYELISIRPKAILTNYEIPFCGHRTAVSLTTSRYMQAFAERTGCHVALHCNRAERLISCGEYPVFLARDGALFTPPAETFPACTERDLMFRACSLAGIPITERNIAASEIPGADELMVFNHTGLQSLLSLGNYYFYNLLALRIEKVLRTITEAGLQA